MSAPSQPSEEIPASQNLEALRTDATELSDAGAIGGTQSATTASHSPTIEENMHPLRRTTTGRSSKSIHVGTLDPEGTAELTRRLTEQSMRSRSRLSVKDQEEGRGGTFDPFDKDGKFELEKFLEQLFVRADEKGLEHREMGLFWRNLTVTGLGSGVSLSSDIGSLVSEPLRIGTHIKNLLHPPVKTILDDFEGCVKPGEMLLVLGRPGSGCTSFLKTMASYRDGFKDVKGEVLYEGLDHTVIDKRLRGDVVYCPEDDVHFPTLTVEQTLRFAASTRAPQARRRLKLSKSDDAEDDVESREGYASLVVEVLATILGLRHTYNTKVGNDLIRGVSGGERKRVSVAETLASRAKIALFDNSSRGLDSSTALEFIRALRIATNIGHMTTVASIYQAGEGLTQLFDKVLVLNEGKQIYFGPMSEAADYFKEMGFLPQDRQTTADFLVACTDAMGRRIKEGWESRVPKTPEEQAAYWRNSRQGKASHQEVEEYYKQLSGHNTEEDAKRYKAIAREDKALHVRKGSPYIISWPMQVRLAIKRRAQIVWGDIATQIVILFASIFQAIITGSVFYQMPKDTSGFFSRGGVLFFALLYNSFTAMSEITAGYAQRPILIRQKRFAMVHPSADAIGNTLLDFPIRLVSLIAFDILIYFMTGLAYTAEQFFVFFGFTLLITFTMVAFFRCLAAACRAESTATMIGGLAVIDLALYAGYVIPRPSMVVWWKWLSYCNPVAFAFEVLIANEFRHLDVPCANFVPNGPGYENADMANKVCPVPSAQPGQMTVDGNEYIDIAFGYTYKNAGRNAGIVFAFWFFFLAIYFVASEYQKDPSAAGGVMVFNRKKAPKAVAAAATAAGDLETAAAQGKVDLDPASNENSANHEAETERAAAKLQSSDSIFSWRDVNYDVMIKGNPRRLLNNVSGFVAPGKMTALMGESGAGKTTLLNVLAQRTDTGVVNGDFLVNGRHLPKSFQADTGYCQQQDVHMPTQTVREALQFSALLRQPREVPKQEKLDYVENVIKLLEMESWAEAMVGNVGEGLNVEQRKRLTIGVELAAKPKLLLFLDEPTSGLDAQAAWSIVRFLRKLADAGQAILCTIHQPSGELFNQFDRLLLLQKGGKTVYFGDIGKNSSKLVQYFEKRSGQKCGEDDNSAEYILDVIGAGATATTKHDWHQLFKESELFEDLQKDLARIEASKSQQQSAEESAIANREYAEPLSVQLGLVIKRAFVHYWRSTVYISSKLLLNIISGLFIGSSFWNQGSYETVAALQNKLFSVFMALVISTSLSQQLQPQFIEFRSIYEAREKPSKMYSWPVAVFSAVVVEMPWNILGGTLFFIPWYFMIGFQTDGVHAGTVWGFLMLFELYFATFAQAVAAMSPNPMIASILFSTLFSFVIIFCGVVQPPTQLPTFWSSWMFHLSPFTYLIEGILGRVITNTPIRCSPIEFNYIVPPTGQTCQQYLGAFSSMLSEPANGAGYYQDGPNGTCAYCQYRQGDDYLDTITFSGSNIYRDMGIICAYIAFNLILCFGIFWLFRVAKFSGKGGAAKPVANKVEEKASSNEDANSAKPAAAPVQEKQAAEPLPVNDAVDGGQVENQDPKV
ncbi:putative SNQ2-ABC transporter [Violaceomyces palustris]|uniref:SNQ2-ABC transporter n=1 Tax=Violaceomyces palustris TaxID=1673888 RepID=A0ACD0NRY2_9BASI|nr:putative SNQ2-ABC transporter [Violaceomyces palustris]